MASLSIRISKLEKALLAAGNDNQEIGVSWMTPVKRRERISYLVGKMTSEEIADFEKRYGFTEGYINLILTPTG